jgi:hypothetical protein
MGMKRIGREYKRIRNTFLLVFMTYVPVCFAVGVASLKLLGTFTPGFVVAGLWMILFLFNGVRLNTWPCPRCGEWFSGTWWYNLGFLARRCVHCGLAKYGNSSRTGSMRRSGNSGFLTGLGARFGMTSVW